MNMPGPWQWKLPRLSGLMVAAVLLGACSGGVPLSSNSQNTGASTGSTATTSTPAPSPTPSPTPPPTPPTAVVPLALQGAPPTAVVAGAAYSFQPTASPITESVAFSIENQPSWATFNSTTGELTGTPAISNVGETTNITITASNGTTSASIGPFDITVSAPSASPPPAGSATLSWVAPILNTDGTALTDLAGYHIHYGTDASQLTQQISISGAASTSYVVSGLAAGTYYFAVTAYASDGTESTQSTVASKTI